MSATNLYAPPKSELVVLEKKAIDSSFYVVSPLKFTVLSLATLGGYYTYWFYKNWKCYKESTRADISPLLRTIGKYFFIHSLFKKIDEKSISNGNVIEWSPSSLATVYLMLIIVSNIVSKLSVKEIGSPFTDIASLILVFVLFSVVYKVQKIINIACNDPLGESNSTLTVPNYLWIGLGLALWGLSFYGIYTYY